MRPPLLVGLGNPLAGDDGVGWHVARAVAKRTGCQGVDVVRATDILRLQDALERRRRVVLVDALLDDHLPPGRVVRFDGLDGLDTGAGSAHYLAPAEALQLLRTLHPEIRDVPITFLGVSIRDARIETGLSRPLRAALDSIADRVMEVLREADVPSSG